jgi:hypothetical protein
MWLVAENLHQWIVDDENRSCFRSIARKHAWNVVMAGRVFSRTFLRADQGCVAWLAPTGIPAMVTGMFGLTRNEQALVAGFLLIFLLGLGVGHWRGSAPLPAVPSRTP